MTTMTSVRPPEAPSGPGDAAPPEYKPALQGGPQGPNGANHGFTPPAGFRPPMGKRGRGFKDPDDFADGVERQIRRLGRLAGEHDASAAARIAGLHAVVDDALAAAVRQLHADGDSYAVIGQELGMTRQAVYQRWFRDAGAAS